MQVTVMRREEIPMEFTPKPPTIILSNDEYLILSQDWTVVLETLKRDDVCLKIKQQNHDWLLELHDIPKKSRFSRLVRVIAGELAWEIMGLEDLISQIQKVYGFEVNGLSEW